MEKPVLMEQMPNIGKVLAKKLNQVEITTPEELCAMGTEQVFIRLSAIDSTACLSMLQALEGAIQGIRWYDLPIHRKAELKEFYHLLKL